MAAFLKLVLAYLWRKNSDGWVYINLAAAADNGANSSNRPASRLDLKRVKQL